MQFKVGDKVKVSKASRWKRRIGDTIGVVVSIIGNIISAKWETDKCIICGIENKCCYPTQVWNFSQSDIYKINVKGQQLLFGFMER